MKFEIEPELPQIRRRTKAQEEFADLLDALETGKAISLSDLATRQEAQQLAMRVRYFATRRGFNITQRYIPDEAKLYLQRSD